MANGYANMFIVYIFHQVSLSISMSGCWVSGRSKGAPNASSSVACVRVSDSGWWPFPIAASETLCLQIQYSRHKHGHSLSVQNSLMHVIWCMHLLLLVITATAAATRTAGAWQGSWDNFFSCAIIFYWKWNKLIHWYQASTATGARVGTASCTHSSSSEESWQWLVPRVQWDWLKKKVLAAAAITGRTGQGPVHGLEIKWQGPTISDFHWKKLTK